MVESDDCRYGADKWGNDGSHLREEPCHYPASMSARPYKPDREYMARLRAYEVMAVSGIVTILGLTLVGASFLPSNPRLKESPEQIQNKKKILRTVGTIPSGAGGLVLLASATYAHLLDKRKKRQEEKRE